MDDCQPVHVLAVFIVLIERGVQAKQKTSLLFSWFRNEDMSKGCTWWMEKKCCTGMLRVTVAAQVVAQQLRVAAK
eukprot:scaffold115681_cov22-Tisochrysis_lutea.AAC.1